MSNVPSESVFRISAPRLASEGSDAGENPVEIPADGIAVSVAVSAAASTGAPVGGALGSERPILPIVELRSKRLFPFDLSAWVVSAIGHGWLLIVLGIWLIESEPLPVDTVLECSFSVPVPNEETLEPLLMDVKQPSDAKLKPVADAPLPVADVASPEIDLPENFTARPVAGRLGAQRRQAESSKPSASDLLRPIAPTGGGLAGREPGRREALAWENGGTPASEAAVERGLRWLAAHQMPDGSWRFDHQKHPHCRGACRDPGTIGSSTASTALALLPFLGAGYTHERGDYQKTVQNGLYYLSSRMVETSHGADLQEGTMYAQALATIVFCEAYTMTGDRALATIAQPALDFIVAGQHSGGGWRYYPGAPGDMTSTGWQIMALRSGQLAKLRVPSPALHLASEFLDQVQEDYGAAYGYQAPGREPTTSAIGLLCRMYLGWPPSHAALVQGTESLVAQGPSTRNMYYNYYAAQVLHHQGATGWPAWNERLREHLVASQADEGHEAGSWAFDDAKTNVAGRLFDTTMAILNLEVYYRYLPLYGEGAVSY